MKDVTAAIIIRDDKVLIARRKAGDSLAHKWEFPGGKVRDGETPEKCLEREMTEEFGVVVSVDKFLGESIYHYPHGAIRLLAYRTYWISGDIQPNVHAEYRWVTCDQLDQFDFSAADIPFVNKLNRMHKTKGSTGETWHL